MHPFGPRATGRMSRRLVLVLVGIGGQVVGVPPASCAEGALPFSALRLSAHTDRSAYIVGQPIALYIRLCNPHTQPAMAHGRLDWAREHAYRWLLVLVGRDGEGFQRYRPHGMPLFTVPPLPPEPMPAGASRTTKVLLSPDGEGCGCLRAPGRLLIKVEYRNVGPREERIAAEGVAVDLREPAGSAARALSWLRDHGAVPLLGDLFWLRDSLTHEDVATLSQFLREFGATAYGPYARYGLAQIYYYKRDYQEAAPHFEQIARDRAALGVADEAAYLAGECRRLLGNTEAARRWYEKVVRRYPNTPAAEKAERALKQQPSRQ